MARLLVCLAGLLLSAQAAKIVPGRAFDRFITIWLENQDFDKVEVDEHFAELKKEGILLTRYYAETHPSQPNYIAAVGGDYFGLDHDDFARIPENVSTIADLLAEKGVSWAGFFEDLPGPGYMARGSDGSTGNGGWDYVRKHNPFISYDSINHHGSKLLNIDSFGAFSRALAARDVPQFCFLSPNMMHDGHNTTLATATAWSHAFLEPLLAPSAFNERTLVMLTYDESEDYGRPNHIASLLLGSAVPPALRGTADDTFYDHYAVLATAQFNWDLATLGRYDAGANVFDFVAASGRADPTSGGRHQHHNREPANAGSVDGSVSYPGFLHSDTKKRLPVPPPNLLLTGASGRGVLDKIRETWEAAKDELTPYDGSGDVRDGRANLPVYKAQAPNVR